MLVAERLVHLMRIAQTTVLILISLSSEPITDYALQLESRSLSGNYTVIPLLGLGDYESLHVNEGGGLTGYKPMPEIPAYGRLILQIQKEDQ